MYYCVSSTTYYGCLAGQGKGVSKVLSESHINNINWCGQEPLQTDIKEENSFILVYTINKTLNNLFRVKV